MGNMCNSAMAAAQEHKAAAEQHIRASGGGDMLDKAKEKVADGVPIDYGKEVDVPSLALKGGECHIGIKYTSVEGECVDAEFGAIEFNADGHKVDYATYNHTETSDGALQHLGDSTSSDGAEYISVKLSELSDDIRSVVFCIYIYNGLTMSAYDSIKLVFKAVGGETVVPVCNMTIEDKGKHSGCTCLAFFREGDGWKIKNVYSKGEGPTNDDMIPACRRIFKDIGMKPFVDPEGVNLEE